MINWKIRLMDKTFWVLLIPAVLTLVQAIAAAFGFVLDLGDIGNRLLAVVEALFMVLGIVGIVRDPTTPGIDDSQRAMAYVEPGVLPEGAKE